MVLELVYLLRWNIIVEILHSQTNIFQLSMMQVSLFIYRSTWVQIGPINNDLGLPE